jgi:carbon monoxide dehydrogenase subunit G
MKITNEFVVQIPIDQAWQVLTDLEGIAPCMPGAQLTGVEGDVYKGKVKVKVGPVISEFAGTAQFTEKDDTAYRAVIDAKGRDARSAGNAAALVSASLTAEGPSSTKVSVDTDLKISGKLAQFGSGMIKEVSSKLLAQFVANLEKKLATDQSAPASADGGSAAAPAASAAAAAAAPASSVAAAPAASSAAAAPAASSAAAVSVSSAAAAAPAASSAAAPAADSSASAAAVATAPDTAVALGAAAPAASAASDETAGAAVAPDPSAGEVEPAAGRIETAAGTPEPVAPLRVPDADLAAAPHAVAEAVSSTRGTDAVSGNAAAAAPSAAPSAAGTSAASAERVIQSEEPEALDLLAVAGGSIYKRVIPVAVGAVVVAAAVIVWFVARG